MTPQVYENLEILTYGELVAAIDRLTEKLRAEGVDIDTSDFAYYIALMQELDSRQKEE